MRYVLAALTLLLVFPDAALARGRGYSRSIARRSGVVRTAARRPIVSRSKRSAPRRTSTSGTSRSSGNRAFISRRGVSTGRSGSSRGASGTRGSSSRSRSTRRTSFTNLRERSSTRKLSRPTFRRAEDPEEKEFVPREGALILTGAHFTVRDGGPTRTHEVAGGSAFIGSTRSDSSWHSVGGGGGVNWGVPDTSPPAGDSGEASGGNAITPRS